MMIVRLFNQHFVLASEEDPIADNRIMANRSYEEDDLDALLVARNAPAISQTVSPHTPKESSVVVIRSIRTVDDLFEELNDDKKFVASLKQPIDCDNDNGSELIYVQ